MIVKFFDNDENRLKDCDTISSCKHTESTNTAELVGYGIPENAAYFAFTDVYNSLQLFKIMQRTTDAITHEVSLYGENDLYELVTERPMGDVKTTDKTAAEALETALDGTRFAPGVVTTTEPASTRWFYISPYAALQDIETVWPVRVRARYEASGAKITGRYVDLLPIEPTFSGKRFEVGKDVLSANIVLDMREVVTAVIGRGKSQGGETNFAKRVEFDAVEWSVDKGDPVDKPKGQNYVEDAAATAMYGIAGNRPLFGIAVFDGISDSKELLRKSWELLQTKKQPILTGEITATALDRMGFPHEQARLGDAVNFIAGGIRTRAEIVEVVREYAVAGQDDFTFGKPGDTMSARIAKVQAETAANTASISSTSEVVGKLSEDGTVLQQRMEDVEGNVGSLSISAQIVEQRMEDVEGNVGLLSVTAQKITERVSDAEDNVASLIITAGQIEQRVEDNEGDIAALTLTAQGLTGRMENAEGSITALEVTAEGLSADISKKVDDKTYQAYISAAAQEIGTKVSAGEIASAINQTPQTVSISASKINLSGYVTADQLEAQSARITLLQSGSSSFNNIVCTLSGSFGSMYIGGATCALHRLTIGDKGCFIFAPTDATFELSDMPGFAEAMAAAEQKGFASASIKSISVLDSNYLKTSKAYDVTLDVVLNNDTSQEHLVSIGATEAYNAGVTDGYSSGYSDGKQDGKDSVYVKSVDPYDEKASGTNVNATIDVVLSTGESSEHKITVDATSVYNAGKSEVTCQYVEYAYEAGSLYVYVSLSNGKYTTHRVRGW